MKEGVQAVLARREGRSPRRQQVQALVAAFLIHALAVTAAFAVPRLTRGEREYPEYVAVHVMPAAALAPQRPATPEPEPPPQPPPPEPAPPPPPPPPEPDPEIPVLPTEEAEPAPQSPPPAPPEPADTPGEPTAGGPYLGARVVGPGGAAFPFDYYLDRMLGTIRQSWVRPPVQGIEALISFRVLRNGEIIGVEIRESSGSRAFDLAALRAVRNASPLPPLPTSYREDVLTVNLIVR